MLRFELLQTPRGDGEVLIEPAVPLWAKLLRQNVRDRESGRCNVRLAGMPLAEARRATRERICGPGLTAPVIACGHQPEFAHPGVWAKHVVVRHVAEQLGLHSLDLVVDNDAPHTTALSLPRADAEGFVTQHTVPVFNGIVGAAHEGRPPLSLAAVEAVARNVRATLPDAATAAGSSDQAMVFDYLNGLATARDPRDFVAQHLEGRRGLDEALKADLREVRVSEAFDGPFVADILLDLARFAREYNASLAEYRREQHVRSPDRPLPDLKRAGDRHEAPFWIYRPLQQRRRLWIRDEADAIEVFADDVPVGTLRRTDLLQDPGAALASLAPWVIRPRALTLTLWARLLVCDFFVHGIGGAKYDRINDGIFRRYYGCEPPPYACVTATLRLPLPRFDVSRADVLDARRRIRDLRFNPQRYVEGVPADLLAERERLIGESEKLRDSKAGRLDRRHVFVAIRALNARIAGLAPQLDGRLAEQADALTRRLQSNVTADSREFFYALQPRSRLESLASRLREAATGPDASSPRR